MRVSLLALLLAAAGFAGCMTADVPADDLSEQALPPSEPVALPDPIEDSKMVAGGIDVFNMVVGSPCTQSISACYRYPVELLGNATLDAKVTWTVPANDFDLYVFQDGEQVEVSGATPPGTEEAITIALGPGSYEVIVVAWAVAQDTYKLTVNFS